MLGCTKRNTPDVRVGDQLNWSSQEHCANFCDRMFACTKRNTPDVRVGDPLNWSSQERCANSCDRMFALTKRNTPDVRVGDPLNWSSQERCANFCDRNILIQWVTAARPIFEIVCYSDFTMQFLMNVSVSVAPPESSAW